MLLSWVLSCRLAVTWDLVCVRANSDAWFLNECCVGEVVAEAN